MRWRRNNPTNLLDQIIVRVVGKCRDVLQQNDIAKQIAFELLQNLRRVRNNAHELPMHSHPHY